MHAHNTMSHQPPKIIETSHISPPNGTVPSTTLPLTVADIIWLNIAPVELLLFYSYPIITKELFLKEFLPNLKQTLSITLQHFFPFASNIIIPPYPELPYISYLEDSSLLFLVAESVRNNFDHILSDAPKDAKLLDDFMPKLPPPRFSPEGFHILPAMAMQLTIFPGYGISLGSSLRHVVGDGASFSNFMKFWMSLINGGDPVSLLPYLPNHSCRKAIKDPGGVAIGFLKQYFDQNQSKDIINVSLESKVRATFTLMCDQIENLKRWITEQTSPTSTFVVTLALVWVSFIKTLLMDEDDQTRNGGKDETFHLVFFIDYRNRLKYEEKLVSNYMGNCLAPGFVSVKKQDLVGENGVLFASNAIKACIKEMLSGDIVKTSPTWRQRLQEWMATRFLVTITGGPRLGLYDLDFGLGKPCKLEMMHTKFRGMISISESRDGINGVEIGLVLEKMQMETFASTLQHETNKSSAPCLYARL